MKLRLGSTDLILSQVIEEREPESWEANGQGLQTGSDPARTRTCFLPPGPLLFSYNPALAFGRVEPSCATNSSEGDPF